MSASVVPVVAVMLAVLTWDFIKKSGETLGWMRAIIIDWLCPAILIEALHIHPAIVILGCILSVFSPLLKRRKKA